MHRMLFENLRSCLAGAARCVLVAGAGLLLGLQSAQAGGSGTLGDPYTTLSDAYTVPSSGRYYFNTGSGTFEADVDTAEGGGWVLVLQYVHDGGTNPTLSVLGAGANLPVTSAAALGTDESGDATRWGHAGNAAMSQFTGDIELRWYGDTSNHGRVIHFRSSLGDDYVRTGAGNFSGIEANFTALSGHTANLPSATTNLQSNRGDGALTNVPFFVTGTYHWSIQGNGSRWEVDDTPANSSQNTRHQVWVRQTPGTTEVTNTNDSGVGSLRDAITNANADPGEDDITFNIPGAGPHTITLASQLPTITDAGVSIDGSTQSGASCGDLWGGTPHTLMVRLDSGSGSDPGYGAIVTEAADTLIKGLSITRFSNGIALGTGSSNATVQCSYVGLAPDGTAAGNFTNGFQVLGAAARIGGLTPGQGNVIGSNRSAVITQSGSTDTAIRGNFIGTDPSGTLARPNTLRAINNASGSATWRDITKNLISGNSSTAGGIQLESDDTITGSAGDVVIAGNYIGVDRTGNTALGNSGPGIQFDANSISNVTIGGTSASDRNVISSNALQGVLLTTITNVDLLGNYIGLGADGTTDLGNVEEGINLIGVATVAIGNGTAAGRNVISDNGGGAIANRSTSTGVTVRGNYLGLNAAGNAMVSNGYAAVHLRDSTDTIVGGSGSGDGNLIAQQLNWSIIQYVSATSVIQNNTFGLTAGGGNLSASRAINLGINAEALIVGNTIRNATVYGIAVTGAAEVAIVGNSIAGSGNLGIDLGDDGVVDANDSGDGDGGPNEGLNFPVLNTIGANGTTELAVDFNLDAPANGAGYRIDFFKNTSPDSSGHGEGEIHLGFIEVTGPGSDTRFAAGFTANAAVSAGDSISATATRIVSGTTYDITSEFSANLLATMATPLVVTSTADTDTPGTLRYAINHANANTGDDAITFNIPSSDPNHSAGVWTIPLSSSLPALNDAGISVDGTTQTGASCGELTTGTPHALAIELDGSGAGAGGLSFDVRAADILVRGFSITGFDFTGVRAWNGGDNAVFECLYLGVRPDGVTGDANARNASTLRGVYLVQVSNATIRNSLISGNDHDANDNGIDIENVNGATITGNIIGLNDTGTAALPNGQHGISVYSDSSNITIGGTTAATRNVISGNSDRGVAMVGVSGITMLGNYIGTDVTGTVDLSNGDTGIRVASASTIQIGNGTASGRNVVSGNNANGISVFSATGVAFEGNYIGTTATGNTALGNSLSGMSIQDSSDVTLGGTAPSSGNVISGNAGGSGVYLYGTSSDVTFEGNHIGVGADGATALGNAHSGIWVDNSAAATIGGTATNAANILANNANDGVTLRNTATVAILTNTISANGDIGIDLISNGVTANDSGDGDNGPNELLNFPVINGISADSTVDITYDFNLDVPSHGNGYRIDFFKNTVADASGHGEGEIHLGSVDVAHAGGDLTFTGSLTANAAVSVGDIISATTTRKTSGVTYDITSEFSANATAQDPLIVTRTADSGVGTLRGAIDYANANTAADAITFDIPTSDSNHSGGVWTISTLNPLTVSDDGISIDASTQPGATCGGSVDGNGVLTDRALAIEIDGTNSNGDVLRVQSSAVTIRGFAIGLTASFFDSAIDFDTGASGTVICNHLGTTADGLTARAIEGYAVETGFSGNVADSVQIGDGTYAGRNVMANTRRAEIQCQDNGVTCDIRGNYVGVFADGFTPGTGISNNTVWIGGNNSVVGGPTAPERNVIGLSIDTGVAFSNGPSGVTVENNYIGVAADGVTILDPALTGAINGIEDSDTVQTLTNLTIRDNVIGGFPNYGMDFEDATLSSATITGNHIGVGSDGTTDVAYGLNGIVLGAQTHTGMTIGGTGTDDGNVIGFMSNAGIKVVGTTNLTILGNHIGIGADGTTATGNGGHGISIDSASGITIGGTTSTARNVISGNGDDGIALSGASSTSILGNYIGLGADGSTDLGNVGAGVTAFSSSGTVIGNGAGGGNVIAGNGQFGISLSGGTDATIDGNIVGRDAANSVARTNGLSGILVQGSTATIGSAAVGNIISDNTQAGIFVTQSATATIRGNTIDNNGGNGVRSDDSVVTFGGAGAGEGNTLRDNVRDGLRVNGTSVVSSVANSISGSGDTGIDLADDGVTANDAGDGDTGPNDLLNFPMINFFAADGSTAVSYNIDLDVPAHPAGYRVDFFVDNTSGDTNGEGETHLGGVEPLAPGTGLTGSFTANAAVNLGDTISATVTRIVSGVSYDITSEFSVNATATDPLVVTSTADSGAGTLRAAIDYANANTGEDDITFNIAGAGPHTITLASQLPTITDAGVSIDGTTQSGASCGDLWGGTPHTLMVRLDSGSGSDPGYGAIVTEAADTLIKGLSITRFSNGIALGTGSSNATVQCSYVGLAPNGTAAGNFTNGFQVLGAAARIGGLTPGQGNVIGSNRSAIITQPGSTDTAIRGNFIGTDPSGTLARPNTLRAVNNASGSATWRDITKNLISGNSSTAGAIQLESDDTVTGSAGDVVIAGNYIGVDRTGNTALGNSGPGIQFDANSISNVTIGGTSASDRNVISSNALGGIRLDTVSDIDILGNYIGAGADGSTDLGNGSAGIRAISVGTLQIGDGTALGRNVISGNSADGLIVNSSTGVTIQGNYIGTNATGNTALPNSNSGMSIDDTDTVMIGGTAAGAGNVISGNAAGSGIFLHGTSSDVTIEGNHIGVGADGTTALGNAHSGIWVQETASAIIGGTASGAANILFNNANDGVTVRGTATAAILTNTIYANGNIGIDLNSDSVTANDSGDGDSGGNDLLNYPVINGIAADGTVDIAYHFNLDVPANASGYRIDFFKNTAADASGFGEGETHLGAVMVSHAGGDLTFTGTLTANAPVSVGNLVSATVTRVTGAMSYDITSEFSANIAATDPLIVTSTADSGAGTLRAAIEYANANAGADAITFNIAGAGPHRVTLSGTLPSITDAGISIDGSTQGGASCGQLTTGTPHDLRIILDGGGTGASAVAPFVVNSASVTLRGMSIVNSDNHAIQTNVGASNLLAECLYVGVEPDGVTANPNARGDTVAPAIKLEDVAGAIFRNSLISGNADDIGDDGLRVKGSSNVIVQGNLIGVSVDGLSALANGRNGIDIDNASSNVTVGGTTTATLNVISGNGGNGVLLDGVSNITIHGNYIGLGTDGSTALGNGANGIEVEGVTTLAIGDGTAAGRNIIADNTNDGIELNGTIDGLVIDNNYIGLTADGVTARGNGVGDNGNGIEFNAATSDGDIVRNNVISDSAGGVYSLNGSVTNLLFTGNYVGTDATGLLPRGNEYFGLALDTGADAWTIGTAASGNIFAATENSGAGVEIEAGSHTFQNNLVGVGADGTTALGNEGSALRLATGSHVIGGTGAGEGNVFANSGAFFADILVRGGATATISGNTIRDGLGYAGLDISSSGTTVTFHDNIISNGAEAGIQVNSSAQLYAYNNTITDSGTYGIIVTGATTKAAIYGNSISGNGNLGIELTPLGVTANDAGDGDTGPNDLLNFPVINGFTADGTVDIDYDFNLDVPSNGSGYRIDFFKNTAADASGHGEGEIHLGSVDVAHAGGDLNFTGSLTANAAVSVGDIISTTATRKTGGTTYDITSEFNANATAANPLVVTSTADSGTGTLRAAIDYANANTGKDDITFNIAGAGPHTITFASDLPDITDDGVSIDGTTQSGASCGQLSTGTPHTLMIELDGGGGDINLLYADAADVTFKGLAIGNSQNKGFFNSSSATGTRLECNHAGVRADGVTRWPLITKDSFIGANQLQADGAVVINTLFSGNDDDSDVGFFLTDLNGATVTGNVFGLTASGNATLPNGGNGLVLRNVTNATIGGATAALRNIISGNGGHGLVIENTSSNITVLGNYIGTDVTGAVDLGNGDTGIQLQSANTIQIGNGTASGRNVVSGNDSNGISVFSSAGASVQGNYIGTTQTGDVALGNSLSGMVIQDSSNVAIGGTATGAGNVISGNAGGSGVYLYGTSSAVTFEGNLIGVGADGTTALGNAHSGIWVDNSAAATIGGTATGATNILANNANDGVTLRNTAAVAIFANAINANGDIGIDLVGNGVTANDAGDGDTGPNELLNFPVINGIGADGTVDITYDFNLDVPSNGNGYRIDFFKNTAADASGHGEGEIHLGSVDVAHAGGDLNFTGSLTANAAVSVGDIISTTATRKTSGVTYDITSEFSANAIAADPLIVTSTADSGAGTLRAVIEYANANAAADNITFNITGAGPHTIAPLTPLPFVTDDNVSIDGSTQPGATCGSATNATRGITDRDLRIVIDGSSLASGDGLRFQYGDSATVKGLVFGGAPGNGLNLEYVYGTVTVLCSHFGVDAAGTAAFGNGGSGLRQEGADDAIIGDGTIAGANVFGGNLIGLNFRDNAGDGSVRRNFIGVGIDGVTDIPNTLRGMSLVDSGYGTPIQIGDRTGGGNIISGNTGEGVFITNGLWEFYGNYIGTDGAGLTAVPNGGEGIRGTGESLTLGDGTTAGRNIISGNDSDGLYLRNSTGTGTIIDGNLIGVAADGSALGNDGAGINFYSFSGSQGAVLRNNTIANNGNDGVTIVSGATDTAAIYANSIYDNTGLGIDLGGGTEDANGVTANDSGDGDIGTNDLLNYPVVNGFAADGTTAVGYDIDLDVPAHPAGYRVDFFLNTAADSSGYGEGETHLGAVEPLAPGTGLTGTFTANAAVSPGDLISATVTRIVSGTTYDITSEFSLNVTAGDPLIVTSTADSGAGSLRAAITFANANPGSTVEFDITGAGPHTITLASDLPAISASGTIIDGLTQTGATCGQLTTGTPHDLRIALDGNSGAADVGLEVASADNVIIRGLSFGGFNFNAIRQSSADTGTQITCNYIGVAPDGTAATPVSLDNTNTVAVRLSAGIDPVIDNNLISGNSDDPDDRGLYVFNVTGASVTGNIIGLDETGTAALGNANRGITVDGTSSSITVGGTTPETRNVISGNGLYGVHVTTDASTITLLGNHIGTSLDGQSGLGNGTDGVRIDGTDTVAIGNGTSAGRNVVSGNGESGVSINAGASGITLLGNYLGLAADGSTDLGNTENGLTVAAASGVTIGDGSSGGRNVISGNDIFGLTVRSTTTLIANGNYIGTDATGQSDRGNSNNGLRLYSNQGDTPMSGLVFANNVISGNDQGGVDISSGSITDLGVSVSASFTGNRIGVAADGMTALGNAQDGLKNTSTTGTITVGGSGVNDGNIIAYNGQSGVRVDGNDGATLIVLGNSIYSNSALGIDLDDVGVTLNDSGDGDSGPNDLLNFPLIDQIIGYGTTDFDYGVTLDVPAHGPGYRVDFFLNSAADASGYGEGETHLGHVDVSGPGSHSGTLSGNASVGPDDVISATLTRKTGGTTFDVTSEFSLAAAALAPTDNGDAPASYGDAAHRVDPTIRLGAAIDFDGGAQASANADGDDSDGTDDEDGVSIPALAIGGSGTISVDVTGAGGYLQAWMDFDGDGSFDDPTEQIANDLSDSDGDGTILVPVTIPAGATTAQTFARFRWSTDFTIGSSGEAPDGEVEDYAVTFTSAATTLAGTLILDNGSGGGTAHDGIQNGWEPVVGVASVAIYETAGGTLLTAATVDGGGAWSATLPFGFAGEVAIVAAPARGYLSVSEGGVSGLPGLSNPSTEDGSVAFTPVSGTAYAGIAFGLVAAPSLSADQNATIQAGQVLELDHSYTATTSASLTVTLTDIVESAPGAISLSLWHDSDCDGFVDTILGGPLSVSAGESICLVARAQASGGLPQGATLSYTMLATTALTGTTITREDRNSDRITGSGGGQGGGDVSLRKYVRNITQGTPEGTRNSGDIGDVLEYRIELTNPGANPITNITVNDQTPAYTTLSVPVTSPIAVAPGVSCSVTTPNTPGYSGPIEWDCPGSFPPGGLGSVTFQVQIAP